MKFKRLLILFCVLAMCVGTCAPAFADTASSGDEITVLFTHDLHSHLLPDHIHGIDHVPQGFTHLLFPVAPPAVGKNTLGHGQVHGMKHGGPIHRMGGQNIFADQMMGGTPPVLKFGIVRTVTHSTDIVDQ